MIVFETLKPWFERRRELKNHQQSIGFVPTMGALHDGHLSLIRASQKENDLTAVSVFVNPTQFNNTDDFNNYPVQIENDLALLKKSNVDFVILPSVAEVYKEGYNYKIHESHDSHILCGQYRPGHFDGVLTVVMKLLNIVQPQNCYMGEKDYQQFHLVKQMSQHFFMDTKIVPCPTVRESSGLAMSSRNLRLSSAARQKAALLHYALTQTDFPSLGARRAHLEKAGFQVDYFEEHWGRRFVAATIEGVRLIDNVNVEVNS